MGEEREEEVYSGGKWQFKNTCFSLSFSLRRRRRRDRGREPKVRFNLFGSKTEFSGLIEKNIKANKSVTKLCFN